MGTKVTVLGQEEPKKELKKIQLTHCAQYDTGIFICLGSIDVSVYKELFLLGEEAFIIEDVKYDVFAGKYRDNKEIHILLGHFNDGIV